MYEGVPASVGGSESKIPARNQTIRQRIPK
jgi:hypothetical protein